MLEQLSDIMTMDELHHPWLWNELGYAKLVTDPSVMEQTKRDRYQSTIKRFAKDGVQINDRSIKRIAILMRQVLEAPFPEGRKDMAWFERATESRKRLSVCWDAVRGELRAVQLA